MDLFSSLLSDFRNFVFLVWRHLDLPEPTELQYDMARYLQHGPRRRMLEAFRGAAKSWLTAAYVLWRLLKDPNERILVASASKDRADAFSTFVKRLIHEMPVLEHLRPRPEDGQRDSIVAFDVGPSAAHQAPSVKSVGITGQLAGSRATIIVSDDVEIPKNSLTVTMRDRLSEAVKEYDAVLVPDGEIIYLGTPQTEDSVYQKLPERGYAVRIWPARYPNARLQKVYGDSLSPMLAERLRADPGLATACGGRGAPTEPSRFSDVDLLEREASYGRSGFSLQFMLDTSLSDADRYPLKLSDLVVMSVDADIAPVKIAWGSSPDLLLADLPNMGMRGDRLYRPMFVSKEFSKYTGSVMSIDPSGRGGDEVGYAIGKMLNSCIYVPAAGGLLGGYADANLEALAALAKKHNVNWIVIESNFGDGMFTKLFTPFLARVGYPCTVEEVVSSQQKERRIIDTLEPVLNQHRLIVAPEVLREDFKSIERYPDESSKHYSLFHQMTRITKDRGSLKKDDRVDALAMMVAYWVEQMDKNTETAEAEAREALREADLAKFTEGIFGTTKSQPSWIGGLA